MKASTKRFLYILQNISIGLFMLSFLTTLGSLFSAFFIFSYEAGELAFKVFLYSIIPTIILFCLAAFLPDAPVKDKKSYSDRLQNLKKTKDLDLTLGQLYDLKKKNEVFSKQNQLSQKHKELSSVEKLAGLYMIDKLFGGGLFGKK
ncbi:MAG: hypothetical protein IJ180_04935 [Bacteroidales bacterium]|nr:hypothetical protein [Bacteroidales bacterium]